MQPEDQVCSLELSKKLLTLGVNENSMFHYLNIDGEGKYYLYHEDSFPEECEYEGEPISAFTASELGELLPNSILKPEMAPFDNYRLTIRKFISADEVMKQTNNFIINYECDSTELAGEQSFFTRKLTSNIYDPNLSNAMAKMLIFLIENNLIERKKYE